MNARTWSGRWHAWFPVAFFWAMGAVAFGFMFRAIDWTLDPGAVTFIVVPVAAVIWAALAALLFYPVALVSILVGACLDAAQGLWGRA